jgi:hypothetical protein
MGFKEIDEKWMQSCYMVDDEMAKDNDRVA